MFDIPVIPGAAEWINAVFSGMDQSITLFIHQLYDLGGDIMTKVMEIISLFGKHGMFLIALALVLAFFKKTRRFGTAMCVGLFLGALFVNIYLKMSYWRLLLPLRPYQRRIRRHGPGLYPGQKALELAGAGLRRADGHLPDLSGGPLPQRRVRRHDHRNDRRHDRHLLRAHRPALVVPLGRPEKER